MAKAVADVSGENYAGFASDHSSITGFSHMHDSGTGGVGSVPILSLSAFLIPDYDSFRYASVSACVHFLEEITDE